MGRRTLLAATNQTFNPASIGSLHLWLDGADTSSMTVVSGGISEWRDKSGGDRHVTQTTAGNRPTPSFLNGLPAVRFASASSQTLSRAGSFLDGDPAFTVFVVFQKLSAQTVTPFGWGSQNTGALFLLFPSQVGGSASSYSFGGATTYNFILNNGDPDSFHPLNKTWFDCFVKPAGPVTRASAFRSGQYFPPASASTASPNISGPLVIGQTPGAAQFFDGLIGEILVYSKALTPSERQQVEQYISAKWRTTLANYKLATSVATPAVSSPLDIPNCAIWLDSADTSTLYTGSVGPVTPVVTPLDISGCVGWWDASDTSTLFQDTGGTTLTPQGGSVARWNDKSGAGNHAVQATAVAQPSRDTLNSFAALYCAGDDSLVAPRAADATHTVLAVVAPALQVANGAAPLAISSIAGFHSNAGTGDMTWYQRSDGLYITATITFGLGPAIVGWTNNNATVTTLKNGFTVASGTANTAVSTATGLTFGRRPSGGHFTGHVCEAVVFDSVLSAVDLARVEKYLANKWGIFNVHARITDSGQPVRYWGDKSGNGRHFNSTTAPPTFRQVAHNGRPALVFNSSNLRCVNQNDAVTQETVFLVAAVTNTVNFSRFFTQGTAAGSDFAVTGHWIPLLRSAATENICSYADGAARSTSAFVTGTPTVMTATHTGAALTNRANAVSGTDYTHALSQTINRYGIFDDTAAGAITNGRVMEAIVYHRALSLAERARVERYLTDKWGLGVGPPVAGHPEAQDWVRRVYSNGGTVSQNTVDAVSDFLRAVEAAGLRSRLYRVNLFCGNALTACQVPVIRGPSASTRFGHDTDILTQYVTGSFFTAADYVECGPGGGLTGRLGAAGNQNFGPGLRTGIVPGQIEAFLAGTDKNAFLSGITSRAYNDFHMGVYCDYFRQPTVAGQIAIGNYTGVGAASNARHGLGLGLAPSYMTLGTFSAQASLAYDGNARGLFVHNVKGTANFYTGASYGVLLELYAGPFKYHSVENQLGPWASPSADLAVFSEGRDAVSAGTSHLGLFRLEQTLQGYTIGLGLTTQEAKTYSDIWDRFQRRLDRGPPVIRVPTFSGVTHPDALDWIERVYRNSGSVSQATASAVQTFCAAIDSAGIRDRFYRLNLFCGNNLAAATCPLYLGPVTGGTPSGNTLDAAANFVGTDYVETGANGGLTGGTNRYLDTGFRLSDADIATLGHLSVYSYWIAAAAAGSNSVLEGWTDTNIRTGLRHTTSGVSAFYASSASIVSQVVSSQLTPGHWVASRTSSTLLTLYTNAATAPGGLAVQTTAAVSGLNTGSLCVFGSRQGTTTPTAGFSGRLSSYSFGRALSAAQVTSFYNALQAFQTALNRQV